MKVHFVGPLASYFVKEELKIFEREYDVTTFDLSKYASSFKQMPAFLIRSLFEWKHVKQSNLVWIWYADYPAVPFMLLAKLFRKPVVVLAVGWEVCAERDIGYGNQLKLVRGWVTRWILRHATRCVAMSNTYETRIKRLVPQANVLRIYRGIDTSLCDAELPKCKIGVVTALVNEQRDSVLKGIPTFLEATKHIDFSKVLVNLPHDQLIEYLKEAEIYCQLSHNESFGITAMEAAACGCMIVATEEDALPEILKGCALFVPYGDAELTEKAIHVEHIRQFDTKPIREHARMYSLQRQAQTIYRLVESLT